jgi:hypothetical protein
METEKTYNSTSGKKFQYNGHLPVIAVIGIHDSKNQFTRAVVEDYGFDVVHVDPDHHSIPMNADAAICVTSYVGHDKFGQAKDEYKKQGKKVFFARDGFSELRGEFEEFFFGELKTMLVPVSVNMRLYYLLGHIYREPRAKFRFREFYQKVIRHYPGTEVQKLYLFMRNAESTGTISKPEGTRGKYRFEGIAPGIVKKFSEKYGIEIKKEWWLPETVQVSPEVVVEPPSLPEPLKSEGMDLVLDVLSSIEKKMESFQGRMSAIEEKLHRPGAMRLSPEEMKSELTSAVKQMSIADLSRVHAFVKLMHR